MSEQFPDSSGSAPNSLIREQIRTVVETLPSPDREVILMRFGLKDNSPRTLSEVGECLNLSREEVKAIEARALEALHT